MAVRLTDAGAVRDDNPVEPIGIINFGGMSPAFQPPNPLAWQFAGAAGGIVNTTTAVTIQAAGADSVRNYLTFLYISHDVLGSGTELAIRDGAGGPVIWRTKLQTAATEQLSIALAQPLQGTAATLMEVVTLQAVTGAVYVNAQGFQGP